MEVGGWCMAVTRNDVQDDSSDCLWDPNSKKSQQKQLVTGPCLFFSKLIQIFEGRIPSRRLLHQPLYNHASSCTTVFWHQMRLAETAPKTCEVFKCLTLKLAKELIRRDTQAVLAQVDFKNQPLALKESREAYSKCFCSSKVSQDYWDSRKRPSGSVLNLLPCKSSFFRLLRFRKRPSGSVLNLLPCKSSFFSDCWDFEKLEVEGLRTDSMPCWGSGGFPNCQKCVHQESSNYCWIGQGDLDVSIPSKLQAIMKSTCYPAGKAFEASQSHRKLRPICSTCSLAASSTSMSYIVTRIVTGIIANIIENSIWKTAQAVVAEINFTDFPKALKRPLFNHLQAIVAQVKFLKTAEILKKTFWKCSQFVALQIKIVQTAEILKYSRPSGSVLNLLPCKSSFFRLLRFWKTRGGRASNWFHAMLRVRRLSKLSKMCSSRVIKLLLDRSRWSRCFNPFKAPGKNEVNLLSCRKSLPSITKPSKAPSNLLNMFPCSLSVTA